MAERHQNYYMETANEGFEHYREILNDAISKFGAGDTVGSREAMLGLGRRIIAGEAVTRIVERGGVDGLFDLIYADILGVLRATARDGAEQLRQREAAHA